LIQLIENLIQVKYALQFLHIVKILKVVQCVMAVNCLFSYLKKMCWILLKK